MKTHSNPKSRKAYSYVRFSNRKQATGDSLRRQTTATELWAARKGVQLDTSLTLHDLGVSAWQGKNAEFGELAAFIRLAKDGTIPKGSYLVIESLDRLSRQKVRAARKVFDSILDAGITIVTLNPDREYEPDSEDPLQIIEPIFQLIAANDKSETLSVRVRAARQTKRMTNEVYTAQVPSWVRVKADGSGLELIPEKAKVVRKIVSLALEGYGDLRISKWLIEHGIPPITGHHTWTRNFISKVLVSPSLIGTWQPHTMRTAAELAAAKENGQQVAKRKPIGEAKENYYPAVITPEDFAKVRATRNSRTFARGPIGESVANLFTGLLFNARDGFPLNRAIKNMPRLVSAGQRNGEIESDPHSFPYEPFERAFLQSTIDKLKLGDLFADAEPVADPCDDLRTTLQDLDARIKTLTAKAANHPDVAALTDMLVNLDSKRKQTQADLEQQEALVATTSKKEVSAAFDDLRRLALSKDEPTRMKLRARIRQLVESMHVLIYAKGKNCFRLAECQIHWRAGGISMLSTCAIRDEMQFSLFHRRPKLAYDFRKRDEVAGYDAEQSAAFLETLPTTPILKRKPK